MASCTVCKKFGLGFRRTYRPAEFIEGNREARIWIVGLNPAQDIDWRDVRRVKDLETYFDDESEVHPYFRDFKTVSPRLYDLLGRPLGAAHTDLVKCASRTFPPTNVSSSQARTIVSNCSKHLEAQLAAGNPKIVICNGSRVSQEIKRLLPPPADIPAEATQYMHCANGREVAVVLSGFIGRIDNFAKRRLGRDIEALMKAMKIA
jgi:uracil-DNA glycosylase